jgi:hypothetical protein
VATTVVKLAPGQSATIPGAATSAQVTKYFYGVRVTQQLAGTYAPVGFDYGLPPVTTSQTGPFPEKVPVDGANPITVSTARLMPFGAGVGHGCLVTFLRTAGTALRLAFMQAIGVGSAHNVNQSVGPDFQVIPPGTQRIGDEPALAGAGAGPYTGNLTFAGAQPLFPVDRGTVVVRLAGLLAGIDGRTGGSISPPQPSGPRISPIRVASGSIDYDTGAVSLTFDAPVPAGLPIKFDYFSLDPIIELEYSTP